MDEGRPQLHGAALQPAEGRSTNSNVSQLGLAWYADLDTFRGVEATPLAIDGVTLQHRARGTSPTRTKPTTGKLLWTYDPKVPREWGRYACCEPVARGLAAWKGKIIIGTLDGRLIALDAKTGTPVWTTQTFDKNWPYSITGAPRVFDGKRRRRQRRWRLRCARAS